MDLDTTDDLDALDDAQRAALLDSTPIQVAAWLDVSEAHAVMVLAALREIT